MNLKVTVLINSVSKVFHILAHAHLIVDILQKEVSIFIDARRFFPNYFLSIEVRHAFTTHYSCENILVCVHKRVNSSFAEFLYQLLDSIKIIVVVDFGAAFNCLPHNAEAHKVLTPALQVGDILIVE